MAKAVTFEFASDAIDQYNVIIQKPNNDTFNLVMQSNPETFQLEEGEWFVYMIRVLGSPGAEYKLTITGPSEVRSPVERSIGDGVNEDTYLDDFLA